MRSDAAAISELNMRHLRAVVAVASCGTLSAAALQVALSQPALTQGLAKLERALGSLLFERLPEGMRPTRAGAILAMRVATAMRLLADAMQAIRSKGGARGFACADVLLTMSQIRAMSSIGREGGYVVAARAIGVSQAAVHGAIRDIERLIGATLVERRGRGIALTDCGAGLARACRLVLREIAVALDEIATSRGEDRGAIAIGTMPLAQAWLLPIAIERFRAIEPHVSFRVAGGSHSELIEPLRDGEFDMLVGALRDPPPGPDIVQEPLLIDELAIVGRAAHPQFQGGARLDLRSMATRSWLAPLPGTPLRALWEALFAEAGLQLPKIWMECGSVTVMRGLLLANDHLTLLSPVQVQEDVAGGLLVAVPLAKPSASRTIGVTTRAGWCPTSTQERFIATLRGVARSSEL